MSDEKTLLREFKNALLVRNVIARVTGNKIVSMEHDSPEALKKYLKDHPNADKANHTVKKDEGGASKSKDDKAGDADVVRMTKHTERLHKTVQTAASSLEKLTGQFDRATGYKGDKERAKRLADKITNAHQDALTATDVCILHAKGLVNIARKHGRSEDDLDRLEAQIDDAEKEVKESKGRHKSLKGEWSEQSDAGYMADSAKKLERAMMAITSAAALLQKK